MVAKTHLFGDSNAGFLEIIDLQRIYLLEVWVL